HHDAAVGRQGHAFGLIVAAGIRCNVSAAAERGVEGPIWVIAGYGEVIRGRRHARGVDLADGNNLAVRLQGRIERLLIGTGEIGQYGAVAAETRIDAPVGHKAADGEMADRVSAGTAADEDDSSIRL